MIIASADTEKIKKIIDVIDIRLSMSRPPHIIYIPYQDFPNDIQRSDINRLLRKLDEEFGAIRFSQIVGLKVSEQEVGIRIQDDKFKFRVFILLSCRTAGEGSNHQGNIFRGLSMQKGLSAPFTAFRC